MFIPVNDSHSPKGQGRVEKKSPFKCKELGYVQDPALHRVEWLGMLALFSNWYMASWSDSHETRSQGLGKAMADVGRRHIWEASAAEYHLLMCFSASVFTKWLSATVSKIFTIRSTLYNRGSQ